MRNAKAGSQLLFAVSVNLTAIGPLQVSGHGKVKSPASTSRAMTLHDPHQENLTEVACCGRADIRVPRYIEWLCAPTVPGHAIASLLVFPGPCMNSSRGTVVLPFAATLVADT
jgi:hypothetical protein